MQVLEASDELATDDSLLRLLFSMMKSSSTFDNAVSLAEELLAVKPGCFNLCSIGFMLFFLLLIKEEGICEMISNFSLRKLAFFCRVFSQLLFDPTKFTQGNNLILGSTEKSEPSPSTDLIDRHNLPNFDQLISIDSNQGSSLVIVINTKY